MADRPLLLCYDGSEPAKHALAAVSSLFTPRPNLVLSVWQNLDALPSFGWMAAGATTIDVEQIRSEASSRAEDLAAQGAEVARAAGIDATPLAVNAHGPIWQTIVETAEERDAAAIVLGSRGLTGVKNVLLGSVSEAVVRHAKRPTLVIHPSD
jgi:nucleotide-binding universal stress UspA family protein